MMKKIFIVGLIVCSFFVISISSVLAVSQTITINDDTDDVSDYFSEGVVSSNPNIDITKLTYSRQETFVTLTLEVNGSIENLGHLSDIDADEANFILYSMIVSNSNDSYTIYYVNNECQITYESEEATENITPSVFSAVGSDLTVSFNLLNNDETYDGIYADTLYYKVTLLDDENYEYLYDMAPDEVTLEVTAGSSPSEGKIGESIHFSGEASGGTEYAWLWDFDDETTSIAQNPIHSYAEAGTYEVTLSVTDAEGNEGSSSLLTITISDAEPSNGGDNDGEQGSSNSGLILFVVIIAIIAIAGIAVVVYIIRR